MTTSVKVWRIATDTPDYTADDRSGAGAKNTGGRWNRAGTPLLYCASSIALACLETVVHLNFDGLPLNRFLVEITIPESVWQAGETFAQNNNVGWNATPAGKVSLNAGDEWAASLQSLVLRVPSVLVPEEQNILINPRHPDIDKLTFRKVRQWTYDSRLLKVATPKKSRSAAGQ